MDRLRLTYGFILKALCAGMGMDPHNIPAWWIVQRAEHPYFSDCFPGGLTPLEAQFMIDHFNDEIPADVLFHLAT